MTNAEWLYIAVGVGAIYLLTKDNAPSQAAAGAAAGAFNPTNAGGSPNPADAAPIGSDSPVGLFAGAIGQQDAGQPGAGSVPVASAEETFAPVGAIVGGEAGAATGAMSPLTAGRVKIPGGNDTQIVAPDDAAGRAALFALGTRPAAPDPNPTAPPQMTLTKVSTSGMGIVPPASRDRVSTLSPEIRRFQPLRSVGR